MPPSSTQLYNRKARNYAQFRPDYAPEAVSEFVDASGLPRESVVVDVGSGTGTLTRHLLDHFDTVYAVEPTLEMRQIAEANLGNRPGFISLPDQAENMSLPDKSVRMISAGQAIHWFNPELTLAEFQRISTPGTWLFLAAIRSTNEAFNQALNTIFTEENGLLPLADQPPSDLAPKSFYFLDGAYTTKGLPHSKDESWECFIGGIGSGAFAPDKEHPAYPNFVQAARQVFDQFSQDGLLTWQITTEVTFGYVA